MCSSIVFVPNLICHAAALLIFGSKYIWCAAVSSFYFAPCHINWLCQWKEARCQNYSWTKIVCFPSNGIVTVQKNDWSVSVRCLSGHAFQKGFRGNWEFWVIPDPALFLWTNTALKRCKLYTLTWFSLEQTHWSVNDIDSSS